MKRIAPLLLVTLIIVSCKQEPESMQRLYWLPGTWEMKTPDGVLTEEWRKESDTAWTGEGHFITVKEDTVFSEQLKLVSRNDTLWYIATIPDQNDGLPIGFREKSFEGNTVIFENIEHDFPQRIVYTRISDTSMDASVEGMTDEEERKESFHFSRK